MTTQTADAPYGYKADGTPRKRRGRPPRTKAKPKAGAGTLLARIAVELDGEIAKAAKALAGAEAEHARLVAARDALVSQCG